MSACCLHDDSSDTNYPLLCKIVRSMEGVYSVQSLYSHCTNRATTAWGSHITYQSPLVEISSTARMLRSSNYGLCQRTILQNLAQLILVLNKNESEVKVSCIGSHRESILVMEFYKSGICLALHYTRLYRLMLTSPA